MHHTKSLNNPLYVFVLGLPLVLLATASAQLGSIHSPHVPKAPQRNAPIIQPFAYYSGADYATGGVGLRNQNDGGITISGLPVGLGMPQDAYLYWSVLLPSASVPPAVTTVRLIRTAPVGPTAGVATLAGDLIATGGDPCWGSYGNFIYRAHVPVSVASGNGSYLIKLMAGASGLTDGEDPWDGNVVFPLFEGASLIIVGNGTHVVSVFDGIAGLTSIGTPVEYVLSLIVPTTGGPVLWDNIGADGQVGFSRTAGPEAQETTTINGVPIAGPGIGAIDSDSDWNGSAASPLPQLWDDTGHDITAAGPQGTTSLDVFFTSPADCWNTVVNVVSQ